MEFVKAHKQRVCEMALIAIIYYYRAYTDVKYQDR